MPKIKQFELFAVELPFKKPFKHAACERSTSQSLFLKCQTEEGVVGFGECLPRDYVTGETRDGAYQLLKEKFLPKLIGKEFHSFDEVKMFLHACDGKAPVEWVDPSLPQTATWCAVDLALLDCFGKAFQESIFPKDNDHVNKDLRYSGVLSADKGFKLIKKLLLFRLFGLASVKVKVEKDVESKSFDWMQKILGARADIRIDANMAWNTDQARTAMKTISQFNIRSFEQPLSVNHLDECAQLIKDTGLEVMADEDINTKESLTEIIEKKAFTSINVRISKCGGWIAAQNRCEQTKSAGLILQVGSQVGESSLLSAANLALIKTVEGIRYAEGCFGLHLLKEDPAEPMVQFGFAGRPPHISRQHGLGVTINEEILRKYCTASDVVAEIQESIPS